MSTLGSACWDRKTSAMSFSPYDYLCKVKIALCSLGTTKGCYTKVQAFWGAFSDTVPHWTNLSEKRKVPKLLERRPIQWADDLNPTGENTKGKSRTGRMLFHMYCDVMFSILCLSCKGCFMITSGIGRGAELRQLPSSVSPGFPAQSIPQTWSQC